LSSKNKVSHVFFYVGEARKGEVLKPQSPIERGRGKKLKEWGWLSRKKKKTFGQSTEYEYPTRGKNFWAKTPEKGGKEKEVLAKTTEGKPAWSEKKWIVY